MDSKTDAAVWSTDGGSLQMRDGTEVQVRFRDVVSEVERREVCALAGDSPDRCYAAALGLSWVKVRKNVPYTGRPLRFGKQVLEHLTEEGFRYGDVVAAGSWAFVRMARSIVDGEEVEARANFTEEEAE